MARNKNYVAVKDAVPRTKEAAQEICVHVLMDLREALAPQTRDLPQILNAMDIANRDIEFVLDQTEISFNQKEFEPQKGRSIVNNESIKLAGFMMEKCSKVLMRELLKKDIRGLLRDEGKSFIRNVMIGFNAAASEVKRWDRSIERNIPAPLPTKETLSVIALAAIPTIH